MTENQLIKSVTHVNYLIPFLDELATYGNIIPALNQVEFSPYLHLKDLLNYCEDKQIQLQAYTPLVRGERMADPKLVKMAQNIIKHPPKLSSDGFCKEEFQLFRNQLIWLV